MKIIMRSILVLISLVYITWIWLQSSYFNPSSLEYLLVEVDYIIILMLGAALELAHLIEFGILYSLIILVFLSFGKLNSRKEFLALTISLCYAMVDELHQYFVPYRSFSMIDMLKNGVGIWAFWFVIRRKYYGSKPSRIRSFLEGITSVINKSGVPSDSAHTHFK
jgi:hypothetical protein